MSPHARDEENHHLITWIDEDMVSPSSLCTKQSEGEVAAAIRTILADLGEDIERDGLRKTPERAANAWRFFTRGYTMSVEATVGDALFDIDHNDMVLTRDIDISSLCEHHLLPFFGKAHIAYIPNGRVIGLSKVARIVEIYSRRLQVQERLTRQIADSIQLVIAAAGVRVVVECSHVCMMMRGVMQTGATTVTQSKTGVFATDDRLDEQFQALLNVRPQG